MGMQKPESKLSVKPVCLTAFDVTSFYLATRGNYVCTGHRPGMLYSDMLHICCCWGGAKDRQNKIHLMPPLVSSSQVCGGGQILCVCWL